MTAPLHGLNRTLCRAMNGRDGCTCKHGTSCESSFQLIVQDIANTLQISTTDMANLATGRARVVLNPIRRTRPEAMGKGRQVTRRPTLDELDGDA
jgi:hypothetical protein